MCLLQPSFALITTVILALDFFMLCFLHGIAKKSKEQSSLFITVKKKKQRRKVYRNNINEYETEVQGPRERREKWGKWSMNV